MYRLNLDKKNDILYLTVKDTSNSYGDELMGGVLVLYDLESEDVTGITIFDFLKKCNNGTINKLQLPIKINFKEDVIKRLS